MLGGTGLETDIRPRASIRAHRGGYLLEQAEAALARDHVCWIVNRSACAQLIRYVLETRTLSRAPSRRAVNLNLHVIAAPSCPCPRPCNPPFPRASCQLLMQPPNEARNLFRVGNFLGVA